MKMLNELGYSLFLSNEVEDVFDFDRVLFSEAYSVGMHHLRFKSRAKYMVKRFFGGIGRDLYSRLLNVGMYNRLALAVFEVPLVIPEHGDQRLFSMFPVSFTSNDDLANGKNIRKFCYPQPVEWPQPEDIPFKNKKLLINVSSNKRCDHPLEVYSVRHEDIRCFDANLPEDFDLYGFGWGADKRTYRGVLEEHKSKAYSRYRFGLCYENSIYPGNIDEKIFDCMRSNCVPVFLGAPNVKDYVDENAFIDRRDFKSAGELGRYLLEMTEKEYNERLEAARAYLAGPKFAQFLSPAFAETLVKGFESVRT